ncbi:MAG: transketolase family protein [Dehalococcoidales bacterium]|nr:transketolase family protein [Dehalococcoidales bacterium]
MAPEVSMRESYGQTLVEMGKSNPDLVVLDADLSRSTMTHLFGREFPDRFFDCGIAEENMIGIAAGLAASGKLTFASTFAVFAPGRCFDQLRMAVAQPQLNVKIVTTHGGVTVGEDGASHQAIEDLALAGSLPGLTVIVPADALEAVQAVKTAASTAGPFLIRLCRPKTALLHEANYQFKLGQADTMRPGTDVTIIAIGLMVAEALQAARNLESAGISCRVLNMSTLKPIDEAAIIQAAKETGAIVTAEEHLAHGGLGSAVARVLGQHHPVPMELIAIDDTYCQSGKPAELLEMYGLTAKDIERAVRAVIPRKHRA